MGSARMGIGSVGDFGSCAKTTPSLLGDATAAVRCKLTRMLSMPVYAGLTNAVASRDQPKMQSNYWPMS